MRRVRTEKHHQVAHDPWTGSSRPLGHDDTVHVVSRSGGLESYTVQRHFACGCGCLKPVGGFCAACPQGQNQTACVSCFGFCARCHKPLCTRHSVFMETDEKVGHRDRFCLLCSESLRRMAVLRRVVRFLLAPFVAFDKRHAP